MRLRVENRTTKRRGPWLLTTQALHNRAGRFFGDIWLLQTHGRVLEDAHQCIQRPLGLGKPQCGTNNNTLQYKSDAHCGKSAGLLERDVNCKNRCGRRWSDCAHRRHNPKRQRTTPQLMRTDLLKITTSKALTSSPGCQINNSAFTSATSTTRAFALERRRNFERKHRRHCSPPACAN